MKSTSKGNFTITTKMNGNLELTTKRKEVKKQIKAKSPNPARDVKPQSRPNTRVFEPKAKPARGRQATKYQATDRDRIDRREREVIRLPSSGINYVTELSGKLELKI